MLERVKLVERPVTEAIPLNPSGWVWLNMVDLNINPEFKTSRDTPEFVRKQSDMITRHLIQEPFVVGEKASRTHALAIAEMVVKHLPNAQIVIYAPYASMQRSAANLRLDIIDRMDDMHC